MGGSTTATGDEKEKKTGIPLRGSEAESTQ